MNTPQHRFSVDQKVEVFSDQGNWVSAVVTRLEPYLGRPGYYVMYPDATEQWHCHGGWKSERSVRVAVR